MYVWVNVMKCFWNSGRINNVRKATAKNRNLISFTVSSLKELQWVILMKKSAYQKWLTNKSYKIICMVFYSKEGRLRQTYSIIVLAPV